MKYFAPVSIGNFSVGFDLLGLAISPISGELLGDIVWVEKADTYELVCSGPYADVLPKDSSENLVTLAYQLFIKKMADQAIPTSNVKIYLEKQLPIGSGLGSSASSSVAALYALNKHFNEVFNIDQLLEIAGQLEGEVSGSVHYDNVAPCLLGGLQLMTGVDYLPSISVPFPDSWQIVVSYPGVKVATKLARELLPKQLPLSQTIKYAQNLAVFVQALHTDDENLAAAVLFDVIAEPARKSLIPGFDDYKDFAKSMGAIAFGISGSGSTVFAVTNNTAVSAKIQEYANKHFCKKGGFSHICKVDNFGVRPIQEE
jgi:homoserine kinase